DLEPDIRDGPGIALPLDALSVELHDVSFGYAPAVPTLRNVSFRLEPRGSLGILGRTGSGKTTIARLLLRLYDPTSGIIRVGGIDVHAARLAELRQRVALVTQDVQIFYASVRDNITVFDAGVPDEEILRALKDLGLWEWYQQLPLGLDTLLQSGGNSLSAGEAQLLALTRVFLLNPGIVILDEASSRLDPATERLVDRAVRRLLRDRTSLIIAHRLATIRHVDEILILEDGEVREQGKREQLAEDPRSLLFRLLHTEPQEALA
ncbi:MAG TPA: ABC transporter ATP-binding protein, partial [Herpetosiphonaceae bacterium]|nr:ABC transporter ATP-binding protein [Herpetosiphonaceae bacterium]